jgi:pimeloyl-ACP methyl ester carboxylesterase
MPFTTVDDGVRIHYRTSGSGPTLLFHPGFSNNLDLWNWLVRELAPTHHCVTFDPRGHGDLARPDQRPVLPLNLHPNRWAPQDHAPHLSDKVLR